MATLFLTKGHICPPQGLDFGREVLGKVRQLQERCTMLQKAAERLWDDTKDTQVRTALGSAREPLVPWLVSGPDWVQACPDLACPYSKVAQSARILWPCHVGGAADKLLCWS